MNVKPILFSAPMVQSLLAGRKTQTRRVITKSMALDILSVHRPETLLQSENLPLLPIAVSPGDLMWVRETWGINHVDYIEGNPECRPDITDDHFVYFADECDDEILAEMPRRPSIYMRRWLSRLTLSVSCVRVQRLHEITDEEVICEGVHILPSGDFRDYSEEELVGVASPRESFRSLWDKLNRHRGFGWNENPWVAAYSFEPIKQNVDDYLAQIGRAA